MLNTTTDEPTCKTCGQPIMRDWSGWMHKRKSVRRHVVVPNVKPEGV